MVDLLLWKKLSETDFNAMNGVAAPSGGGGGAMHVALGVNSSAMDVRRFLRLPATDEDDVVKRLHTVGKAGTAGILTFRSRKDRRRGEWLIADQFGDRHPLWRASAGFPETYDADDRPCLLVFRTAGRYRVRHTTERTLADLGADLPPEMVEHDRGVVEIGQDLLTRFPVNVNPFLVELERRMEESTVDDADVPTDREDARRRVIAEIVRRQGQPAFRRDLLRAYGGRCAISGESTAWVLEAAHIEPYLGPASNRISNGLLLRSDLHTLFDLHLLAIDPTDHTVRTSPLLGSAYAHLSGRRVSLPRHKSMRPDPTALRRHHALFSKRLAF